MLCAVILCVSSRTRFCGLNRNIDRSFIHTGTTRPATATIQMLLHSRGVLLLLLLLLLLKCTISLQAVQHNLACTYILDQ